MSLNKLNRHHFQFAASYPNLVFPQIKALQIAAQHFEAGNEHAFKSQVLGLIRSAAKDSQVADIKAAAFDIQFNKQFILAGVGQ